MPLLEVAHLSRVFGPVRRGLPDIRALDDVNLTVEPGEFVSLVGPSGSGKSTLLRIAAGLDRPTGGTVSFEGRAIENPGPERTMVFQQPALYPWLDVARNIGFGLPARRASPVPPGTGFRTADPADQVAQAVHLVGLDGFEHHRPYELSGGMQQRVAIARALITSPRVLLMDEPFGALDAQTRAGMQAFLLHLWQEIHATVLFVTHDVDEAILLSDRIAILSPRPGTVRRNVTVPLMRPRSWDASLDEGFLHVRRTVLAELRRPDEREPEAARGAPPEPVPRRHGRSWS